MQAITFEIFFLTPVFILCIAFYAYKFQRSEVTNSAVLLKILLPILVLTIGYFLVNLYRMDAIVGHYGVKTHLNFSPTILIPNFTAYLLRYTGVHLFFDYTLRDSVYSWLSSTLGLIIQSFIYLLSFLVLGYLFFKNASKNVVPISLFYLFFFISIFPFLNLSVCYNKDIEQDRYLYLSAMFFYPFLVLIVFSVFKKMSYLLLLLFLFVMLSFLQKRVVIWKEVGKIHTSLVNTFRWQEAKRIFIIANADNYNGAYMMRDMPQSAFCEMLEVQRDIKIADKTHTLLQYNILSPSDSCTVSRVDTATLRFEFTQWGNWFWYKSVGATSYDSLLYKVSIDEWNHSFEATFLDKKEGDVYIYQRKGEWVAIGNF